MLAAVDRCQGNLTADEHVASRFSDYVDAVKGRRQEQVAGRDVLPGIERRLRLPSVVGDDNLAASDPTPLERCERAVEAAVGSHAWCEGLK
jgi:hypothetical protein